MLNQTVEQGVCEMKDLTADEIESVAGGIAPLVGWAIAVAIGSAVGGGGFYLAKRWSCV